MKQKIILAVWCVLFASVLVVAVCALILPEEPDYKLLSKCVVTLACFFSAAFLKRRRRANDFLMLQAYRQKYPEFLQKDRAGWHRHRKTLERAVLEQHYDNYSKAIRILDGLIQRAGEDTDALTSALFFRGLCHQRTGNHLACAADWEELLRYRADAATVWDALGTAYFLHLDRIDDAVRCYETSLLYNSENDSAYANLASLYYLKKDDPGKAAAYAEKALKLNPDLHGVCSTLALSYRKLGEPEKSAHYRNQYAAHMPAEDTAGLDNMLEEISPTTKGQDVLFYFPDVT